MFIARVETQHRAANFCLVKVTLKPRMFYVHPGLMNMAASLRRFRPLTL